MRRVRLRKAKARLSAVVKAAARGQPSAIIRRGRPQVVIIGYEEWRRLSNVPSFARLLTSAPIGPEDADLFERDRTPMRETEF